MLATGSLTNLGGAYEKDPHFFEKVKEIVLMGGITEHHTDLHWLPDIFEQLMLHQICSRCYIPVIKADRKKGRRKPWRL